MDILVGHAIDDISHIFSHQSHTPCIIGIHSRVAGYVYYKHMLCGRGLPAGVSPGRRRCKVKHVERIGRRGLCCLGLRRMARIADFLSPVMSVTTTTIVPID